ncbi:MAG: hypothetical protein U0L12_01760 [Ruminococcus sp.]|nr:hypothetical protein [Ruminococcus sp.]
MDEKTVLIRYAQEAIQLSAKEREEVKWLKERYECFRKEMGSMSKQETDNFIYEKMYGISPEKLSDTLKIRYWRTGHHVPNNREILISFAQALNLTKEEKRYLIRAYYDKADLIFSNEDISPVYHERKLLMEKMVQEYFFKAHPERLYHVNVSPDQIEKNLRHLYYTDARRYINSPEHKPAKSHMASVNYGTELSRNIKLIGEISRTTMIRHVIILGIPFISKDIVNQRLLQFGFLPLTEEHSLTGGERLDWLLIRFLELYESKCRGKDPLECAIWFQKASRILDEYFYMEKREAFRFMYFKSLKD